MRDATLDDVMRRLAADRLALEGHAALAERKHAGDDAHQGGLPCAVRADDADRLTPRNLERHAEQRLERSVAGGDGGEREHGVTLVPCRMPCRVSCRDRPRSREDRPPPPWACP